MTIYSWEQVISGEFPLSEYEAGTALTIGSFDGPHLGHGALFDAVLAEKPLAAGIVTFTCPPRAVPSVELETVHKPEQFHGLISTLRQRLEIFRQRGFAFAIVIDFSAEFSKMDGRTFISTLVKHCSMQFLAEGAAFRCGYQGSFGMPDIQTLASAPGFRLSTIYPVLYGEERISSSRIREAVKIGNLSDAEAMLGRPFTLDCRSPLAQVMPPDGSYQVRVKADSAEIIFEEI